MKIFHKKRKDKRKLKQELMKVYKGARVVKCYETDQQFCNDMNGILGLNYRVVDVKLDTDRDVAVVSFVSKRVRGEDIVSRTMEA